MSNFKYNDFCLMFYETRNYVRNMSPRYITSTSMQTYDDMETFELSVVNDNEIEVA